MLTLLSSETALGRANVWALSSITKWSRYGNAAFVVFISPDLPDFLYKRQPLGHAPRGRLSHLDKPALYRVQHQFHNGCNTKLSHNVRPVRLDGVGAD